MEELAKRIAELITRLNHGVDSIGHVLKTNMPELWTIAYRKIITDAWISWSIMVAVCSFIMFCGIMLLKASKKWSRKPGEDGMSSYECGRNWSWIIISFSVLIFLISTKELLLVILNPEFETASYLSKRFIGR